MDRDPWNWTVEDVQHFFRNDAATYIADMPYGHLPSLDPFLSSLHDNDVSGSVLLDSVNFATLGDCGVTSLGQKAAVMRCVTKLQKQSPSYAAQYASFGLQTPPLLPAKTPTPMLAVPSPVEPSAEAVQPVSEHVRPGELQIEDTRGRKRRKLDLSKPAELLQADQGLAALTSTTARSEYFRDAAFPIDEIFYGSTEWGAEIEDLRPPGDVLIIDADRSKGLEDDSFQLLTQNTTLGESSYVYSRMRHFLTKDFEDIDLSRGGRKALALLPYQERLCLKSRSVTVVQFEKDHADPIAVRENAVYLHNNKGDVDPIQQSPGEWDYLMQNHPPTEKDAVSLTSTSEDDDNGSDTSTEDSDAEPMAEVDEDAEDANLSPARTAEVIDEFVEQVIDNWTTNRLPRLEQKQAWTVWKKTKQSYSYREALIQGAEVWIDRFTKRLNKMKDDMVSYTWHSEEQLRVGCDAMEPTIEDREKQKWMIDVWRRRQEPTHTVRHGKAAHQPRQASTGGHAEPMLPIRPSDRYSISPAPMDVDGDDHDADDEMQVDTPNGEDGHDSDQIHYDMKDEDGDAVVSSPALSQDIGDFIVPSAEEAMDDPVIDAGELSEDELQHIQDREQAVSAKDNNYLPTGDEEENESESELPSPSTFVASRKDRTPKKSRNMAVDITTPSDSEPPRRPGRTPKGAVKVTQPSTGDPTSAKAEEVDSWDMGYLVIKEDRLRILIRLLRDAGPEFRNTLNEYLRSQHIGRPLFAAYLKAAVQSCRTSTASPDLPSDKAKIMSQAAGIFIRWAIPRVAQQEKGTLDAQTWNTILEPTQYPLFTNLLAGTLLKKDSKLFVTPKPSPVKGSSSAPIDISSGSDARVPQEPYTPKRHKKVERSAAAKDSRALAQSRQEKYNQSQTTDSAQLVAMLQSDPSISQIEINPVKKTDHDFIYVSDKIAQKMKAHQIDGARFLWRELTADGDNKAQGCILAHTMGLGKTMQTIAFLSALSEASASRKPSTYEQLPQRLRLRGNGKRRHLRMLIICPPGLIENWLREVKMWTQESQLGNIFAIDSGNKNVLMNTLEDWMNVGGVLLMGYQRFQGLLTEKEKKKDNRLPDDIVSYRNILLQGPDIVVADEAQSMKNENADITKVANQIETHSRIALTGTPMSNNVDEIYVLINWVAPNFLGDAKEFRAYFSNPIKDGLYKDSTAYERRKSTMRLKVLHSDIAPKVNRANIEVLKGSLRPKVEFVIKVPLGATQDRIYRRYLQILARADKIEGASQVALFAWLDDLTLVTNHPECLRQKLTAPAKNPKPRDKTPSTGTDSGSATPLPLGFDTIAGEITNDPAEEQGGEKVEGPSLTSDEIKAMLEDFPEDADPALSAKVGIFLKLLDFSLERKDKVLIFSGSLPTLDYLQNLLHGLNKQVGRIDGHTKMEIRTKHLEKFHNGGKFDRDGMNIMLVSTKAGGVGLNIQDANRVFIFDFRWNPTIEEQAIGRSYRLGQQKPVYVYHFLVGGTFEENIYNKRLLKSSLAKRVVDKKNVRRAAEKNPLEYLHDPTPVAQDDILSKIGNDPHVLDRLLAQHGSEEGRIDTMIRGVETMETLQEETKEEILDEEGQKEVNEQIQQGRNRIKDFRPVIPIMRQQPGPSTQGGIPPPAPLAATMQRPPSTMPAAGFNNYRIQQGPAFPTQSPSSAASHSHPYLPSNTQPMQPPQPPSNPQQSPRPLPHQMGGLPFTDTNGSN